MAKFFRAALVAAAAAATASLATAQEWAVQSGGTARVEYNDNYFFTHVDTQSAFTGSITPFVTALRRTETSTVTALLAIGANKVWGISPSVDYLSGRFGLDGSLREARSTWTGTASFVRSFNLQYETGPAGTVLVPAFTNAASVTGGYDYALTERWSLGARAGAYSNRYTAVEEGASLSNNHGYVATGNAGYAYSERTQFTFVVGYSDYFSNVTRSKAVTATVGAVHQFSPQLTISASAGAFWSDVDADENNLLGSSGRDSGGLYGGSVNYRFSERTEFAAFLSENLSPSSSGILTRNDSAGASLIHRFSDRLTGRLGASYTRTTYPATIITSAYTDDNFSGEAGFSYQLAERWTLDAGYRYTSARYAQPAGELGRVRPPATSNLVFVSIGYNWPGASYTDWVGQRSDIQGLPGAGAVTLPERSSGAAVPATAPNDALPPAVSPFEPYTIP